jgi:hypothetical protein
MARVAAAIAAVVFLDALFVEIRRALREGRRLMRRLQGYAELPLFSLLATAEADSERMLLALDAVPALVERAQQAWLVVVTLGRVRPLPAPGNYSPNGSFPD